MSETREALNRVKAALAELNASIGAAHRHGINMMFEIQVGKEKTHRFYTHAMEESGIMMINADQRRQLL